MRGFVSHRTAEGKTKPGQAAAQALAFDHYPQAKTIRVVLDNLSTHKAPHPTLARALQLLQCLALSIAELNDVTCPHDLFPHFVPEGQLIMGNTASRSQQATFTSLQGQYLAFIYAYTVIHRQPPAETDMRRHFQVTPPTVHQMVITLERLGFISRTPRQARSIELRVAPEELPILQHRN